MKANGKMQKTQNKTNMKYSQCYKKITFALLYM